MLANILPLPPCLFDDQWVSEKIAIDAFLTYRYPEIFIMVKTVVQSEKKRLGLLSTTAISGNDLTSSCLYASSVAILYAGAYGWLSLIIVGITLYFFRKIYDEVVSALPQNGGTYNVLLNSTTKSLASFAACLSVLSYMATGAISALEAVQYANILSGCLPIVVVTIMLLGFFALLAIMGIRESARVATVIFVFHLIVLSVLICTSTVFVLLHGIHIFHQNILLSMHSNPVTSVFLGFAAGMLGVTGFETTANYIEEQKKGIFSKALRYMWMLVMVLNPVITMLALTMLPLNSIYHSMNTLLASMGEVSSGRWLGILISIDAVMVLCGAVLTSFVGVGGVVRRMSLDRVIPKYFLKLNKRNAPYRIIVGFFLLCSSVLLFSHGYITTLASVYAIAFLSVMLLFVFGNIFLKLFRNSLPRDKRADTVSITLALIAAFAALIGNIQLHPYNTLIFFKYFLIMLLLVWGMLYRVPLLKVLYTFFHRMSDRYGVFVSIENKLATWIEAINSQKMVFFSKGESLSLLNRAVLYVLRNESTQNLRIVAVLKPGVVLDEQYRNDIECLQRQYPELNIELVVVSGRFSPCLVDQLSKKWRIPKNFMFMGAMGEDFPYRINEFGGARLII